MFGLGNLELCVVLAVDEIENPVRDMTLLAILVQGGSDLPPAVLLMSPLVRGLEQITQLAVKSIAEILDLLLGVIAQVVSP